jgi:glycosyltransferase involved in cell wall biosynthesis
LHLSICLATYNGANYVRQQIETIIMQLEDGDELIVADDGSTDNTVMIIQEYRQYISNLIVGRVGGVNRNFERLISSSNKEYIVLADQDDIWLPNRLKLIRRGLQSHALVLTNGEVVDENLQSVGKSVFEYVGRKQGLFSNLTKNSYVGCCMAFNRDLITPALPFSDNLHAYDWFIGLLGELDGRVLDVKEKTILYRRHKSNLTKTGQRSQNSFFKKIIIRANIIKDIFLLIASNKYSYTVKWLDIK